MSSLKFRLVGSINTGCIVINNKSFYETFDMHVFLNKTIVNYIIVLFTKEKEKLSLSGLSIKTWISWIFLISYILLFYFNVVSEMKLNIKRHGSQKFKISAKHTKRNILTFKNFDAKINQKRKTLLKYQVFGFIKLYKKSDQFIF